MPPLAPHLEVPVNNPSESVDNKHADAAPKVGLVSLGCPKALVDSEQIVTQLRVHGYQICGTYDGADLVVVNTCGFIDEAVQESLDAIGEALTENGKVIVTGCLGAKKNASGTGLIEQVHPKVLAVTGPHALGEVMQAVHTHLPKPHDPFVDLVPPAGVKLTPKHYAYLKISEGCNHRCTFCIIPSMRGELVSRPVAEVMLEAQNLFESGVKELLVISQDTSAYGVDVRFRTGFWNGRPLKTRMAELAAALGELAAQYGAWVRLHYVYPYPSVDEVVPLMADGPCRGHLLPYLDVPLQHAHPDVLKRMKRPANAEKALERVRTWREACPDLVIRSTFIAGFPGETDAQFDALLDFIREAQLDRVGCFAYSPVEGASANELDGALPDEVREARRARFMEVAEAVSAERLKRRVGKTLKVLIDEVNADGGVGRSAADAPEIDGVVYVSPASKASRRYKVGDFVNVKITGAHGHDLWGDCGLEVRVDWLVQRPVDRQHLHDEPVVGLRRDDIVRNVAGARVRDPALWLAGRWRCIGRLFDVPHTVAAGAHRCVQPHHVVRRAARWREVRWGKLAVHERYRPRAARGKQCARRYGSGDARRVLENCHCDSLKQRLIWPLPPFMRRHGHARGVPAIIDNVYRR
ncbi:hypothetical protein DFQ28_006515 [Apophysomyces sp. BC1034]|nr:hypothetical protein DFQ28_006515 [Apophysomyces sp. BC1034]